MRDAQRTSDIQAYDDAIEDLADQIHEKIEASKPITDFCVLGTTQVAMLALMSLLMKPIFAGDGSLRLWAGAIMAALIFWAVTIRVHGIVAVFIEAQILRFRRLLRLPFGVEDRHIVLHSIFWALVFTVQIAAAWGATLAFTELVKLTAGK